jgi:RNA polymerase sigma factor (sigma-70 family)
MIRADTQAENFLAVVAPQVRRLARKIGWQWRRVVDWQDLEQEGLLAAFQMAESYDAAKGLLWTFAMPRVRGAMLDYLRRIDEFGWSHARKLAKGEGVARSFPLSEEAALELEDHREKPELADDFAGFVRELCVGEFRPSEIAILRERFVEGKTLKKLGADRELSESRASQIVSGLLDRAREAAMRGEWGREEALRRIADELAGIIQSAAGRISGNAGREEAGCNSGVNAA